MSQPENFLDGFRLIDGTTLNDALANPQWSLNNNHTATTGGTVANSTICYNTITNITSAAPLAGISLPLAMPGRVQIVLNQSANDIVVYAQDDSTIDGIPGDIGQTLLAGYAKIYMATLLKEWNTFESIDSATLLDYMYIELDIATLRARTSTAANSPLQISLVKNFVDGDGGGIFWLDAADHVTPDNNSTVIVDGAGNRWKRELVQAEYIQIADAGGYYNSSNVEGALQEAYLGVVYLDNYASLKDAIADARVKGASVRVSPGTTNISLSTADSPEVLPYLYLVMSDGPLTINLAAGTHTTSHISQTGDITTGSNVITNLTSTADLYIGMPVVAAFNLPFDSPIVTGILSATSVEISRESGATLVGTTVDFMASICNVGRNSNITILGADPTPFTTVSSVVSVVAGPSGAPNDWLVTYNLADATGITTDDYLKIDTLRPYTFLAGDYAYFTPRVGCGFTGGDVGPYVPGDFPQLVINEMADLATLLNPTIKRGTNTVTWAFFYGSYQLLNLQDVLKVGDLITIKGQTRRITNVPNVSIPLGSDRVDISNNPITVDANWDIDGTSIPIWFLNAAWDSTVTTSGGLSMQVDYGGAIANYFTNNANVGDQLLVDGKLLTITAVSPAGGAQYVKVWPAVNLAAPTHYAIVGTALAHEGTFKVSSVVGNQVTVESKWFGPFPPPKNNISAGNVCAIKTILETSAGNTADGFLVRNGGSLGYLDQVVLRGGAASLGNSYSDGYGINIAGRVNPASPNYINPTQLSSYGDCSTGSFFAVTNWTFGVFLGLGCKYTGFGSHWYANRTFGLWSMEGGTIAARYCIASSNGYYLPPVGSALPSPTGRGLAVNANSTLLFTLGRSVGNNGFGISLEAGTTMYSELPIICHNRGSGLFSNGGGAFEAKSAPIMLNVGSGISSASVTNAQISQVILSGNMRNGLEVTGSANVEATTMWITGNRNTPLNSYSGPALLTPTAPSAVVVAGATPLPAGTYSVRIVAVDGSGGKSFIGPACANQIAGAGSTINITWAAVTGAASYEVWVSNLSSTFTGSISVAVTNYALTDLALLTPYNSITNNYSGQDYGYGLFVQQSTIAADYSASLGNDNSPVAVTGVNSSLSWQQGLSLGTYGSTANGTLVQELARARFSSSRIDALCAALGTYVWIDGSLTPAGGTVALVDYNPPTGPIGLNNRINGIGDRGDWIKSDDLNGVGANRFRATNGLFAGTAVNPATLLDYFQPGTYYNSQNVAWGTASTLTSMVLVGSSTQYPEVSLYRDGMSGHPGVSLRLSDTTMYGGDIWVWDAGGSVPKKVMSFDASGVTIPSVTITTLGVTTLNANTVNVLTNTGLKVKDTDLSNYLSIVPGSNLTADRTLTLTTGDASRTVTISGNATISQDYSTAGNPQFSGLVLQSAIAGATTSTMYNYDSASSGNSIVMAKTRGTAGAPTAVLANDYVTLESFYGYDGTAFREVGRISTQIASIAGVDNISGLMTLNVRPSGVAGVLAAYIGLNGSTATITLYENTVIAAGKTIGLSGSASGVVTLQTAAAAGTWSLTLPTSGGTNNYVLTTNGSGVSSWAQVSLTAGVTGILPLANGGTNANLTASNGGILYSTATAFAVLAGTATAGQILRSGATAAPSWSTATYPATATTTGTILRADGTNWVATTATYPTTTTANQLLYSSAANTVGGLTSANTAALVTDSTGVPSFVAGGTANRVLRTNGTAISFAQVALSTDISGFGTNVATALGNATNGASGICVQDASGRLGIGTTPSYELDVYRSSTTTVLIAARNDNTSACIYSTGSNSYCGTITNTFFGFITNNTPRMSISGAGNVYMPPGATNMTTGFFYIPSAAGAPTGTPTAITGTVPMYYDTTNNNFYIYNGAWKKVALA